MTVASAYPTYWVPRLPEGWQVLRNGRLFGHRVETGFPDLPILEVSLRTGVSVRDMENLKRKQVMSQKEKYKRAVKGDVAYNMMRMWQGAVGPAPVDGLVSPAYVVVKPYDEANSHYYSYLFRTAAYMQEVNKFSRGIVADRNRLYWESFKQMPSLVPPRPEQDQIVAYLRAQDAHIARFIKAKRELISLLQEQKKNTIQTALTNGIVEGVRKKPSEVDWIGEVPAHWEIRKLKQVGRFCSGAGFPIAYQGRASLEIPFFKVSDMTHTGNEMHMLTARNSIRREEAATLGAKTFPAGATIFPKVGGALLTNKRRLLVRNSCIDNNVMAFVPFSGSSEYWYWVLTLLDFGKLANPGPVPALNASTIKDLLIPCPSEEEQNNIVEHIRALCLELDAGIFIEKHGIELIREYRDRLIADVVTGQVDVRGWQPGPDDVVDDAALAALGDNPDDVPQEEDGDGEES
jgi:type I restriction enzyme S subunit